MPRQKPPVLNDEDQIRKRVLEVMYKMMESRKDINSRSDFARAIKTTPQTINKWETGIGHPTPANLANICKAFDINGNWLLIEVGKMEEHADKILRLLEKRVKALEKLTGIQERKK
jgi:transcriptional regulator with XRE-family HTH domain